MKIVFSILIPLFLIAMGTGIYMAYSRNEGLVEDNYYERSKDFFQSKAIERQLDIAVNPPEKLKRGANEINIRVTSHGKPLEKAALNLFIGNISTTGYDRSMNMKEVSPGNYHTQSAIPFKGIWLVRVDLEKNNLRTSKKWFFDVN
ncbi:MAG: FixH family protein [Chlorobiaceae bacterium]|jgi:nitrogen fixation protein FixH|nr:FixH family protein [Chlorobiaceae bacterium]